MIRLILFGTQGCHLCERAEELIGGYQAEKPGLLLIEKIDIAEQEQWQARYAVRIPVLYHIQTGEEFSWPFDQAGLRDFLRTLDQT
ncbi:MAG: glutaredoxin family protein [Gammaproteobacteria bacterium]